MFNKSNFNLYSLGRWVPVAVCRCTPCATHTHAHTDVCKNTNTKSITTAQQQNGNKRWAPVQRQMYTMAWPSSPESPPKEKWWCKKLCVWFANLLLVLLVLLVLLLLRRIVYLLGGDDIWIYCILHFSNTPTHIQMCSNCILVWGRRGWRWDSASLFCPATMMSCKSQANAIGSAIVRKPVRDRAHTFNRCDTPLCAMANVWISILESIERIHLAMRVAMFGARETRA